MTTILVQVFLFVLIAVVFIILLTFMVMVSDRMRDIEESNEEPMFFVKYDEGAFKLKRAHGVEDACYDIYASKDTEITSHGVMIPTGIHLGIPEGYVGIVCPRSGNTIKGLPGNVVCKEETLYNTRINSYVQNGYIDPGYTGEVKVMIHSSKNFSVGSKHIIPRGTKIAQIMFVRTSADELYEVEHLDKTHRGDNGFGSSDSK